MRRAYFDARFLTMVAVLLLFSVALGKLKQEGDWDVSHTTLENTYGLKKLVQWCGISCNSLVGDIVPRLASQSYHPDTEGTVRIVPEVSPLALFPGLCLHSHRPLYITPLALVSLANWL